VQANRRSDADNGFTVLARVLQIWSIDHEEVPFSRESLNRYRQPPLSSCTEPVPIDSAAATRSRTARRPGLRRVFAPRSFGQAGRPVHNCSMRRIRNLSNGTCRIIQKGQPGEDEDKLPNKMAGTMDLAQIWPPSRR
jgi:hypothetical protein